MRRDLDWIVARPIAHRGLHTRAAGIVENTPSAFKAAIDRDFAIECDVQITADGEAVVFHDFALERLTGGSGKVAEHTAAALAALTIKDSTDRIGTLADLFALVRGRVLIVCEIKSTFVGDMRLTERVAEVARGYSGPLVIKSFDPRVVARWQGLSTGIPAGIVAELNYDNHEYDACTPAEKHAMANLLHLRESKFQFVSWSVRALPSGMPFLCREGLGMPVMTWTVRTPEQVALARLHADQMVFEGFLPE